VKKIGAAVVAAAVLSCPTVYAESAPASSAASPTGSIVEVYLPACAKAPVDTRRLVELLRIELGAIGVGDVRTGGAVPATGTRDGAVLAGVIVSWSTCDTLAPEVTIEVVDRVTSKTVTRRMTIVDVPFEERHRALAIAVAELLQASWAELELVPKKPPAVEVPPELRASIVERLTPAPLPAAPERAKALVPLAAVATPPKADGPSVEGMAAVRAFPSRNTALFGGAVSLSVPVTKLWWVHVGADAGGGDTQVAAGSITTVLAAGSVGISAVTGAATKLVLGPRFSAGYAWGTGSPGPSAAAGSYSHFVALAALSATLRVPAAGWTALLAIDVGYTLAQASFLVDDTRAAGIGGAAFGAGLGGAFGI
jgi:hypothetical protein